MELEKLKNGTTSVCQKKFRLEGGGRKIHNNELDQQLQQEILERRERRLAVSCKWVIARALELSNELLNNDGNHSEFKASRGWLQKFFQRHNFTIRRRTTVSQKLPADLLPKLSDFVIFVRKLQIKHSYDSNSIYACDETAVWLDMLPDTSVDLVGVKEVPIKTTGHQKTRITVMLCAKASGVKCKPFVLIKRIRPLLALEKSFPQLNFAYNSSGWMDNETTKKFVRCTLGQISFSRKLLVWDAFRCHISDDTKYLLKQSKIDMAVIPAGCTGLIQPGDVSWNKPFKQSLTEQYCEWMASGKQEYTKSGNMKQVPFEIACHWIVTAWNSLSNDLIKKSFQSCGIGLETDGSQDSEIACFKDDHKCADGKKLLFEKNEILKASGNPLILTVDDPAFEEELNENLFALSEEIDDIESDEEVITVEIP